MHHNRNWETYWRYQWFFIWKMFILLVLINLVYSFICFFFFFKVYSACFEHIFSTLKAASQNVALYCFCNLFSIPEIIRYVRSRFEIKTVTNVDRYPLWSPLFWLVLVEVRKFIRQSIQIIQPSLCKTYNNGRKTLWKFFEILKTLLDCSNI